MFTKKESEDHYPPRRRRATAPPPPREVAFVAHPARVRSAVDLARSARRFGLLLLACSSFLVLLGLWSAQQRMTHTPPKAKNKLATKTLICDTDRTKARTPKRRPAFCCSRRALPGPNKKVGRD